MSKPKTIFCHPSTDLDICLNCGKKWKETKGCVKVATEEYYDKELGVMVGDMSGMKIGGGLTKKQLKKLIT